MQIDREEKIVDQGGFSQTDEWQTARSQAMDAVREVDWPPGTGKFTVYPESEANGVKPATKIFEHNIDNKPLWKETGRKHFKSLLSEMAMLDDAVEMLGEYMDDPEAFVNSSWFDAMAELEINGERHIAVFEWETGNISSSHRSLNRIMVGFLSGIITAGIVGLPTRELYQYSTDRIGNFQELCPYFMIYEALNERVENGVFEVVAFEQDAESTDVPKVPKGSDGMSDRNIREATPDSVDLSDFE
ncbi:restriction endonuclease [Natrinema halophilum]|uniref:Restriction endonuclease n=1 Tax=Natrinema halophilum TaxID=1699371 RepID=A0A7D5GK49_9EURY|nr:restriction endonuclease [Natrinema halophilum]QLG50987.1 restriction endonuclease [Natrinema halophilum]